MIYKVKRTIEYLFFSLLLIFTFMATISWTGTVWNNSTKKEIKKPKAIFYRHVVRMDDDLTYVARDGYYITECKK